MDEFYRKPQSVIDNFKIISVLMGDLNAKEGLDNNGYEEIMGNYRIWDNE